MILADSSVIVDYLRKPFEPKKEKLVRHEAVLCGPVIAEIHVGCRTEAEATETEEALSFLGRVDIPAEVWPKLGRVIRILRRAGTPLPFPDALIATTAAHLEIPLWTRDRHFDRLLLVLPELRLFEEPAS